MVKNLLTSGCSEEDQKSVSEKKQTGIVASSSIFCSLTAIITRDSYSLTLKDMPHGTHFAIWKCSFVIS